RLCDGKCLLGGEDVRHYPLELRADGGIWLDLSDPPADVQRPRLYRSLADAFFEGDWGHAGRTIERLLTGGESPRAILAFGCTWAAEHTPYGFDHGLAVAADVAALLDRATVAHENGGQPAGDDGVDNADDDLVGVLLLQALSLMVDPNLRRPQRPVAAPNDSDCQLAARGDWAAVEAELRRRIEAEDLAGSESLVQAAIAAGAGPGPVFTWLTHAATDHFLDYAHAEIYTVKAEELLDAIGWDHAHPVVTSLVTSIVYGTREDTLPYMRAYDRAMAPHRPRLSEWAASPPATAGADRPLGAAALIAAVVDGDLDQALAAVAGALDRGAEPSRIALALAVAAAHRMLRFDHRLELDDAISEGWLNVTHTLTHADAVRESVRRRPSAAALRGLFHSARFIQHLAVCDLPPDERLSLIEPPATADSASSGTPAVDLTQALASSDAPGAMAAVRRGLAADPSSVAENAAISEVLRRHALNDRASLPIFVAHYVKTTMAALRLSRAVLSDPELSAAEHRDLPLLATVRFLVSPLQERRITRRAKVARTFIRAGQMQTKRLGY
ncbi:MAG: hypothetical protein AAGC55_07845, partial [Myxococcota bacterium]